VASLWRHEDWLPETAIELARTHYSAYMARRADGLRIISLNTNLCTYRVQYSHLHILTFLSQGTSYDVRLFVRHAADLRIIDLITSITST
jgi:hypothetical protein